MKKSFKIYPKKIKLKSVKSSSKGKLTVRWGKIKVDGYYIRYSKYKNFKKYKTINLKANKSKYIIKNLKSKKKYYVKVRAYKKVGKTILAMLFQKK